MIYLLLFNNHHKQILSKVEVKKVKFSNFFLGEFLWCWSDSDEYTSDVKLVNISITKKGKPIAMTKEQYDSWVGNENQNEI